MEPVSVSQMERELDKRFVSTPASLFKLPPESTTGITRHQSSLRPTPKRMTMRERAQALREARLKRLSVSYMGPESEKTENVLESAQHNASKEPGSRHQRGHRATVVAKGSAVEFYDQLWQPLGPTPQGAFRISSKAQGIGRRKKIQSDKKESTPKNAETDIFIPKRTEPHASPGNTNESCPARPEAVRGGHNAPPTVSFHSQKVRTRDDRLKRTFTADLVLGKDAEYVSEDESDFGLVHSKLDSVSPRARKKARVEQDKSALPPIAQPQLRTRENGRRLEPIYPFATATASSPQIAMDSQQQDEIDAPSDKGKSLRSSSRFADPRSPAAVQEKKLNKCSAEPPLTDPQMLGTSEKDSKPHHSQRQLRIGERKSRRLQNRQQKDLNREMSELPYRFVVAADEENQPRAQTKVNTPLRRSPRSAAKAKSAGRPKVEEKSTSGSDHEATDMVDEVEVGSPQPISAEKAIQNKGAMTHGTQSASKGKRTSPRERVLQSVTKSKRIALSASHQGVRFGQPRDSTMSGGRRQSLSHREGLSRLTSVVDQLQREGEVFLEVEHRICEQLIPFSSDSGQHKVSNLVQGYFGAPVSDADRKAIADSALRDAVTHAKLQFQAKQRAAVTELAQSLVSAVKDWKNAKNAVLRDIIPEELRTEAVTPIEPFEQRIGTVDDMNDAAEKSDITGAPHGNGAGKGDEGEERSEEWRKDETYKAEMNGEGNVRFDKEAIRRGSIPGLWVLENASELKQFVGFSYCDLNLGCYRSCAILKLCEFEEGLSYDELYSLTPLGKRMLQKKLAFLVGCEYLNERQVEFSTGNAAMVYHTAAHIAGGQRRR
ncbi:hypothetical protein FGB62_122g028 [Gracilaria domingensis]|nr:hypothetical protein FGB62_122g028 [Gracilaria domingensis]